jgi:hypothetical protein
MPTPRQVFESQNHPLQNASYETPGKKSDALIVAFCSFGILGTSLKPRQMITAGEISSNIACDSREMVEGYLTNI